MNQTAIFDVKDILVNELVGDVTLFVIIGIVMIWLLGSKAKLPLKVMTLFTFVWIALCYSFYASFEILWALAIMFAATMFFYTLFKEMSK